MKTTKQLLALVCITYVFCACNNANKKSNANADTVLQNTESNIANNDSIIYDDNIFPVDSFLHTKILTTGTFHSDEVWDNADKGNWFGLFKNQSGYYVAETKLKLSRVHDEISDEKENEKTAWMVETTNKDTSLILVEGNSLLSPIKVKQTTLSKTQVLPGDTLHINYLGTDYKIFATGGKKKTQESADWFEVWNYKLYVTATINGKQRKSLLVAQPNFNDQMINLIFVGDIDGDGIMDLIIDTSAHYNASSPTIYLSKPANNNEVVKPIGSHTSVGC